MLLPFAACDGAEDPYLVDPRNRVRKIASESRTFILRSTLRFAFTSERVTHVFDGDVKVKASFLSLSANAWTEEHREPTFVQTDFASGKPILLCGEDGKPVIKNGI
jgi:hypothetical protein